MYSGCIRWNLQRWGQKPIRIKNRATRSTSGLGPKTGGGSEDLASNVFARTFAFPMDPRPNPQLRLTAGWSMLSIFDTAAPCLIATNLFNASVKQQCAHAGRVCTPRKHHATPHSSALSPPRTRYCLPLPWLQLLQSKRYPTTDVMPPSL